MAIFSFLPWVHFADSRDGTILSAVPHIAFDASGNQVEKVTGVGDGYLTAILGLLVVLITASVLLVRRQRHLMLLLIVAAGLAAFGVTMFDSLVEWGGYSGDYLIPLDGDPTVILQAMPVIGFLIALCAGILLRARGV